jgi:hypothetical protein
MNTRNALRGTTADAMARVLSAVWNCSERGSVLPHTHQPECGCAELTACRAGRGHAGAVTLEECVRCRAAALGVS